ncbi:hypothetical protein [Maritalea myrionectae]|uniref:hypothetical protein n=1 Tax=Maritalea myrionectae TaxID=454601 RepID=UPI00040D06ED|nr:hypothetical protein [Maritalea myrionectae]
MRKLDLPNKAASSVLALCIQSIRDAGLKERLTAAMDHIEFAEASYLEHAELGKLFQIVQEADVDGVTAEEMKRVYKGTFARSKKTRHIYDLIKKLPANDICPMCGQRTVGTLDHYLAQSLHPALTITPANLLPSCADCNKSKLDAQPLQENEQTLHPYFDNVDDSAWLFAELLEESPAALRYVVKPPAGWSATKQERVLHHFVVFGLGALYASHSAAELVNIRYGLQRISKLGTAKEVREHLQLQFESHQDAHPNSWQTAMYRALVASDWFCEGGFN